MSKVQDSRNSKATEGKKINGNRGMEKRDSIDLSAIDSWVSLHCALRVKSTLSANWWGWIWKGVKWLEDTEVGDEEEEGEGSADEGGREG